MILHCQYCGNVWDYQGKANKNTSCSHCKKYISLKGNKIDNLPLCDILEDVDEKYAYAKLIAVARDNTLLFYEDEKQQLIKFYGEPDKFTKRMVDTVRKEELINYCMCYHWEMGIKYFAPYLSAFRTQQGSS